MPRSFAASQRLNLPAKTTTVLRNRTTWSLMCWFQTATLATSRDIYTEDAAFNDTMYLRVNTANHVEAWFRTPTGLTATMASTATFAANVWHRLMFVRSGAAAFAVWVDEVSVATDATNCGTSNTTTNGVAIGNWTQAAITAGDGSDEPFSGSLFRMIALTEAVSAGEAKRILYTGRTNRSRIFHYELMGQYPEPSLAGLPGGVGLAQAITAGSMPGVTTSLPPGVALL